MKNKNPKLDHIPGDPGNVISDIGFEVLRDPYKFQHSRYEKYGKVYKYKLLFKNWVTLNGPDANEFVLMDQGDIFSNRGGMKSLLEPFFKGGLLLRDFEEHRIHRKALLPAFTPEKIAGYLPIIMATVDQTLRNLPSSGQLQIYPFIKKLTLDISATMLMGIDITTDIRKLNEAFINTVTACVSTIRANIPGTAYHRGKISREYLSCYISQLITKKLEQPGSDMLSHLIKTRFQDNTGLTNQEIIDHTIFMLSAAHDTTTVLVSTMLYALAKYPFWQNKVYQQLSDFGVHNHEFTIEMLDKLTALDLIMHECLRLFTPVTEIRREALKAFSFADYTIPQGTSISIAISLTHKLPEYWTDPDSFDPERFNDSRAEHKQHRFLYLPFGGGAHKCIGMKLAQFEAKLITAMLLLKYQFNLLNNYELKFKFIPLPVPLDNLPLEIKKR